MLKPSIKTITVNTLLTVILVAAFVMSIIITLSFRSLSQKIVQNQALTVSEIIKAGLTSHMKAGIMDKREYFLEEIKSVHNINSINIIRSPEVDKQFGIGNNLEKKTDALTKTVFETKEPVFVLDEYSMTPHIRAIIPYMAVSEGNLVCTSCHNVKEGAILGAVDIELDLTEYRNIALWVISLILSISFMLMLLIIANIFKTVQRHVKAPLESLVDKAREAYLDNKPVDEKYFETIEFSNVAKEINLFNMDIINTQKLIKEKNVELVSLNNEIEETLRETVFTMGVIEEQRSKETKNHTKRVTEYCKLIATKLDLPERDVELVTAAAPLHDIGKIAITDYILLKSSKLTDEEFDIMKAHTKIGHSMLVHSKRDILQAAAIIALQHHEKWDGSGYPNGLKGEEIHIFGRIVALADIFDALSTARSYKEAWSMEKIIDIIKDGNGKHFDPAIVNVFFEHMDEFLKIKEKYGTA